VQLRVREPHAPGQRGDEQQHLAVDADAKGAFLFVNLVD